MAGNPFAGQGITGLYDAPLKAAVDAAGQKMAMNAVNKRTFASLIGTGLTTANNAIQSKQNRIVQESMNREDNLAQAQRIQDQKMANLDYQNQLMKQKDDFSNTNVGALMETFHEIDTNAIDPETAVALKKMKIQTGLSMDPTNTQLRGLAKQIFATDDMGVDKLIAGEDIPLDSPYLNTTRDVIKSRTAGEKATNTKKVLEAIKTDEEVKALQINGENIAAGNKRMTDFLERENLTPDEKIDFSNIAAIRADMLADKDSRAKYKKDAETFLVGRSRLVEYTSAMESLEGKFKQLEEAGVELNIAPLQNAVYETVGDADAASVQDFITKLKEENFYVSGGNLTPQQMDDMRKSILVDVNKIIAGTAYVGRNFLGQTGTQTEQDFAHNLAGVFLPGQSVSTRIENLRKGKQIYDSALIQQSYLYGDADFAARRLRKFHDDGATLDEFGGIKPEYRGEWDATTKNASFNQTEGQVPQSQPIQVQYGNELVNFGGDQQLPDMTQDSGYNLIDGSVDGEEDYSLLYNDI
jgi:hypothetical protein